MQQSHRTIFAALSLLVAWLFLTMGAEAALTASKTAAPATVTTGVPTAVNYVLTVSNTSTFADEVVITDDLPPGVTFNAMTDFRLNGVTQIPGPLPTIVGNRLTWSNAGAGHQIFAGQNLRIRFSASITAPADGRYYSQVTATDLTGQPDDPPDDVAVTAYNQAVITAGAFPTLTNGLARAPTGIIPLSGAVTFTDTINNNGGATATNLSVVVPMPPGWTYDGSFTPTWGGVPTGAPSISGQTLTFTGLGTMAAGGPAKQLKYRLTAPGVQGTDFHTTRVYADNAASVASGNVSITVGTTTGVTVVQSAISNTNPLPGEVVSFELTISNAGPSAANVIEIRHDLQAFFTYDVGTGTAFSLNGAPFAPFQHPDNYATNPATLIWTNIGGAGLPVTLNAGDTLVLQFNRTAPTNRTGAWTSRGRADGSNFTLVSGPLTTITIDGPVYTNTLEVLTSPPQISVLPGQILYRITVTNVGTGAGYAVPDWLAPVAPTPAWTYFDDVTSTVAQINGGAADTTNPTIVGGRNYRWKAGTGYLLNPGDVLTVEFKATVVAGTTPGQYPTKTSVTDAVYTANGTLTTGDLAPVTVIAMPTLDLTMTASPSAVTKPATVTYAITVRNNSNSPGPVNTLQLVRTNPNPGGWSHINGSTVVTWSRAQTPPNATQAGNGTTYNVSTWLQTYGGGVAGLQPGEWVTITYQYQINVASPNGTYTSSCNASGSNIVDANTGATAPVTVDQPASATITKTVSPASVPSGGGTVTYTMASQNTGSVNLTGSQWFDDLPAGFNYVPGSSQRSYDGVTWTAIADPTFISGNTWRWTTSVGTINTVGPSGPTLRIRFQAVTTPTSGTYSNVARYQATQLSQISSGATAPVTVGTPPAITLNLSRNPASIPAGGPTKATYTLTLQNTGGTPAQGVNVRAILPGFLAYVSGTSDLTIAAPTADPLVTTSLTWNNLGDIPVGQTLTLAWQVIADSAAPAGSYYMEVSADGSNFASVSTGSPPSGGASIPALTVTSAANVVLTAFNAEATPDGVQLRWRSGSEWRHMGYQVIRQVEGESQQQAMIDHLIGGPGNQVAARDYQWKDTAVQPGVTYAYWLEDVELGGMTSRHGPIRIQVPQSGTVKESWAPPALAYLPPDTPSPDVALLPVDQAARPQLTILDADDTGITLDLYTLPLQALQEEGYSRIVIPGMATIQEEGQFELPMAVTALGLPPGARYQLKVLQRDEPLVLRGALPPVLHFSGGSSGSADSLTASPAPSATPAPVTVQPAADSRSTTTSVPITITRAAAAPATGMNKVTAGNHLTFAFGVLAAQAPFPAVPATTDEAIALRDMDLVRVKLFPVQFDPGTQTITQYRRLRVRLSLDQPARLLSGATDKRVVSSVFDTALTALAAEQGVLRRWVATDTGATAAFQNLPSGGLRLTVTSPGLQRIAADRLSAAGLDLSRPDRLQLFYRGTEVPLHVQTQAGTVTDVTFLADTVGNRYDERALFDLVLADGPGQRMGTFDARPQAGASPAAVRRQVVVADHRFYVANTPPHEASDHWFGDYLIASHDAISVPVALKAPTSGGNKARLSIDLASLAGGGNSRPVSKVVFTVNGQRVGDARWEGARYERVSFPVDPAILQAGTNTVGMRLQDAPQALVYFDRLSLDYDGAWTSPQVRPVAVGRDGPFQVTVPADGTPTVYRVDADGTVTVGDGAQATSGTLRFAGTAAANQRYGLISAPDDRVAIAARPTPELDLRADDWQVDHVIIAPAAFVNEAERLAAYRTGQGLRSQVIPVESIYETFAGGHRDPTAIRDFLRWAVRHWADPKPSYVLLFGDGHYDPLNWSGLDQPTPNPLPPLMTDTSMVGEVPNDTALVSLDGNKGLPSFFVGRLPVNTVAEAKAAVDKLLAYGDAEGPWLQTAIGAQDNDEARFAQTLDRVVNETEGLTWSRFGIDQALGLKAALREGAGLTVYVGHGSDWGWADENIFSGDDLGDLAANGQAGLVVAANCLNGYFASPWFPGLGESLVQLSQAGASTFLGTSGFTLPANQEKLVADLFRHLQAGRDVGMAMTLAKFNLFLRGDPLWSDEVSGWLLLGDPATQWRR